MNNRQKKEFHRCLWVNYFKIILIWNHNHLKEKFVAGGSFAKHLMCCIQFILYVPVFQDDHHCKNFFLAYWTKNHIRKIINICFKTMKLQTWLKLQGYCTWIIIWLSFAKFSFFYQIILNTGMIFWGYLPVSAIYLWIFFPENWRTG